MSGDSPNGLGGGQPQPLGVRDAHVVEGGPQAGCRSDCQHLCRGAPCCMGREDESEVTSDRGLTPQGEHEHYQVINP